MPFLAPAIAIAIVMIYYLHSVPRILLYVLSLIFTLCHCTQRPCVPFFLICLEYALPMLFVLFVGVCIYHHLRSFDFKRKISSNLTPCPDATPSAESRVSSADEPAACPAVCCGHPVTSASIVLM